MNTIEKLPKIVMWVLMGICIIAGVMFYVGGSAGSIDVAGDMLDIPRYTDLFIYVIYALVVLAIIVTLMAVCKAYAGSVKSNPKAAVKSLIPICLFVLLFVITWFLGSAEEMPIIGYEGTDNVGFWAQCTDMICYSVYALLVITILTAVGGLVYTKLKK